MLQVWTQPSVTPSPRGVAFSLPGFAEEQIRRVTVLFVNLGLKEQTLLAAAVYDEAMEEMHRVRCYYTMPYARSCQKYIFRGRFGSSLWRLLVSIVSETCFVGLDIVYFMNAEVEGITPIITITTTITIGPCTWYRINVSISSRIVFRFVDRGFH